MVDRIEEFAREAELSPNDPAAWLKLARALIDAGAVYPGRHVLHRAMGVAQRDPDVWLEIGRTLERLGSIDEAVDAYRRVCRLKPGAGGELALGRLLLRDGEVEAAEIEARNALQHTPQDPRIHGLLARALLAQERLDSSIAHTEAAIAPQDPDEGDLRFAAALYARLEQPGRRVDLLERLSNKLPHDPEILIELGHAAFESHDRPRATAAFDRALGMMPLSGPTLVRLAHGLRRLGRLEEAGTHLLRVVADDPTDDEARRLITEVLQELEAHKARPSKSKNLDVDIRSFGLPELIEFLSQQQASGVLELVTDGGVARITMAQGAIASADAIGDAPFIDRLAARGVSKEALRAAGIDLHTPPLEVISRLAARIKDEVLQAAVSQIAVESLVPILYLRDGRATFVRTPTPEGLDPELLVSTRAALLDAMRAIDERSIGRPGLSGDLGYSTS